MSLLAHREPLTCRTQRSRVMLQKRFYSMRRPGEGQNVPMAILYTTNEVNGLNAIARENPECPVAPRRETLRRCKVPCPSDNAIGNRFRNKL
jgi:hypothetical protein